MKDPCVKWGHYFHDGDHRPCQCREFASAEALRAHNRSMGNKRTFFKQATRR